MGVSAFKLPCGQCQLHLVRLLNSFVNTNPKIEPWMPPVQQFAKPGSVVFLSLVVQRGATHSAIGNKAPIRTRQPISGTRPPGSKAGWKKPSRVVQRIESGSTRTKFSTRDWKEIVEQVSSHLSWR